MDSPTPKYRSITPLAAELCETMRKDELQAAVDEVSEQIVYVKARMNHIISQVQATTSAAEAAYARINNHEEKLMQALEIARQFTVTNQQNFERVDTRLKQLESNMNASLAIAANANAAVLAVIKENKELKERIDAIDASEGVVGVYPNRLRLLSVRSRTPTPPGSPAYEPDTWA
jgi:DNA repair ATPase RecN